MKKEAEDTLKRLEEKMHRIQGMEAITFIRVKTAPDTHNVIYGYLPPDWEIDYFVTLSKDMVYKIPNREQNPSLEFYLLTVEEFLEDFENTEKEHGILESLRKNYVKDQSDL